MANNITYLIDWKSTIRFFERSILLGNDHPKIMKRRFRSNNWSYFSRIRRLCNDRVIYNKSIKYR
jgi:hypothetical protein